ncbi:glutathione S-transferase [Salinivibrio proteolyticus]|uniref:glutathione S-transferase family protein n=1 Tax=Salinivibrio proteolyticus TaxID=334715 RepID=UPI0009895F92|nr:glutathione S-transferase family protein [Salinivibrio proteolyticus]OOF21900.1 glutathione S-transferase [Salinivibrio proteolyticus]
MYTLYYLPGACSLATQVILRELDQPFELINKMTVGSISEVNPANSVPTLLHNESVLTEGAAIMWHLLNTYPSPFMPTDTNNQQKALTDIMFANATMHPAYGRLFFLNQHATESEPLFPLFSAAAQEISRLWHIVELRLQSQPYLGGDEVSAADIMLTVYAQWGALFPVDIQLGPNTQAMLARVQSRPSFIASVNAEQQNSQ